MSKIDAPNIEPTTAPREAVKRPPRPRGRYIDFAPRRKKPGSAEVRGRKISVSSRPVRAPRPVTMERPVVEEELPVVEETLTVEDVVDDGPLAEFNHFDDEDFDLENSLASFADDTDDEESTLESQEDFLAEVDSEDYVEEVLSQVSETHTETTVRRSPFLKNYHIEKRPLSSRAPAREQLPSADALPPTKHTAFKEEEFERRADSAPDNTEEPIRTSEEKKGSKLGMVLTIACTILLGAGVGVFVYLAFFQ